MLEKFLLGKGSIYPSYTVCIITKKSKSKKKDTKHILKPKTIRKISSRNRKLDFLKAYLIVFSGMSTSVFLNNPELKVFASPLQYCFRVGTVAVICN